MNVNNRRKREYKYKRINEGEKDEKGIHILLGGLFHLGMNKIMSKTLKKKLNSI